MKPWQKLREVHDILTAYQRELCEPDESVDHVVTEIERALQRKEICGGSWPHCPLWRRIEALESQVKKIKGEITQNEKTHSDTGNPGYGIHSRYF
jgi:hypothetical protein